MTAVSFDTADLLAQYVTTNTIPNSDIARILEAGGRWWLFHF